VALAGMSACKRSVASFVGLRRRAEEVTFAWKTCAYDGVFVGLSGVMMTCCISRLRTLSQPRSRLLIRADDEIL